MQNHHYMIETMIIHGGLVLIVLIVLMGMILS